MRTFDGKAAARETTAGSWLASRRFASFVVLLLTAIHSFACGSVIPCSQIDYGGCAVEEIDIVGNEQIADDEIKEVLATGEMGTFVEDVPFLSGIDGVTVTKERFDRFVLERDMERIQRLYRARGFYDARVEATRVRRAQPLDPERDGLRDNAVLVEVRIDEGEPVKVHQVDILWKDWDASSNPDVANDVTNAKRRLRLGQVFTEERYETTRANIAKSLTAGGYAYARVEKAAKVDIEKHEVHITYTIEMGPVCTFGPITIDGLGEIPEWQIRPSLDIEEGDPFSTEALEETEVILSDFNVFGAIAIEPQLSTKKPYATAVPIRITVQVSALRTIKLGGGIEAGDQVATRGIAGWQNLNTFGFLDRFNIEGRPRLVAYPWKLTNLFDTLPFMAVPEIAARSQYSFPIPYIRTTVFAIAEGSIGLDRNLVIPDCSAVDDVSTVQENDRTGCSPEDPIRGNRELAGKFGLERKFFLSRFLVSPSFGVRLIDPFSYSDADLPPGIGTINVRTLGLFLELDLRKGAGDKWDPIFPRSGFYAATNVELGGYWLGGDASDVTVRPEARFYAPIGRRIVIAGKLGMGFLYANNYAGPLDAPPRVATLTDFTTDPNKLALRGFAREMQILQLRGLFSGGPSSNRGYGFNQISPHRTIDDEGDQYATQVPTGGRTLWEASLDFRVMFGSTFGGALFIDASDVTPGSPELRLDHPHISTGFGIRYKTPVGPLRLDLGVRIPGLQVIGETGDLGCIAKGEVCELAIVDEGDPDTLFGLPLALSLAIGDAF